MTTFKESKPVSMVTIPLEEYEGLKQNSNTLDKIVSEKGMLFITPRYGYQKCLYVVEPTEALISVGKEIQFLKDELHKIQMDDIKNIGKNKPFWKF